MAPAWHHGDILEAVEAVVPGDRPALVHGDRLIDRRAFARRANNLARARAFVRERLATSGTLPAA
jgi:hypothetical protein